MKENLNVLFIEVDADRGESILAFSGVRSLPSIKIYNRNGVLIETLIGAIEEKLKVKIKELETNAK